VLILGGEPLGEQIVMWWNFVARTHDEVVSYRAAGATFGIQGAYELGVASFEPRRCMAEGNGTRKIDV
jgi:hypothetical protein